MTEEMRSLTGEQLKIGMSAEKTKTMTKEDIEYFGKVSTDTNPMHFNEEYAATTQFGKCIAHGVISLSFADQFWACSFQDLEQFIWDRK